MKEQLEQCLDDFFRGWKFLEPDRGKRVKLCLEKLDFCFQYAPHKKPRSIGNNQRAIYIFFKDDNWLRIGQTGDPNRFKNQHYGVAKGNSTLAKNIQDNAGEFGWSGTNNDEIRHWILGSCGRANLRLPAQGVEPEVSEYFAKLLESYLHYRLKPRFEGRRRRGVRNPRRDGDKQ